MVKVCPVIGVAHTATNQRRRTFVADGERLVHGEFRWTVGRSSRRGDGYRHRPSR